MKKKPYKHRPSRIAVLKGELCLTEYELNCLISALYKITDKVESVRDKVRKMRKDEGE